MARVKKTSVTPQYQYTVRRGKAITQRQFRAGAQGAPILALIVNARRAREGKPGLRGEAMRRAVEKAWAARVRAIGFLRSGWLPAVGVFARAVGKPIGRAVARAQQSRRYIGGATPARPGWRPLAEFIHAAFAKETNNPGVMSLAEEGLNQAVNQEIARIRGRIESRLAADAKKFFHRVTR